ncbi:MAG: CHASE2 domain-containing protein [Armatimonadota bacterium]|nr:CHASE2 domain-containing protein [Armatimonadota bacterium]
MNSFLRRNWGPLRKTADWRQSATWGTVVGLLTGIASLLLLTHHPLGATLEHDTLDFWFMVRNPRPPREVAILAVDEATVRRWGGNTFNDADVSRLLRLLPRYNVRAVALVFSNLTDRGLRYPHQEAFTSAIQTSGITHLPLNFVVETQLTPPRSGNSSSGNSTANTSNSRPAKTVVAPAGLERFAIGLPVDKDWPTLPYYPLSRGSGRRILQAPPDEVLNPAAGAGHIIFLLDANGVARKIPLALPYQGRLYPALVLSTALQATGADRRTIVPTDEWNRPVEPEASRRFTVGGQIIPVRRGTMLLNYPYGARDEPSVETQLPSIFPTVSVAAALDHPELLSALKNKVVVMGPTVWASMFQTPVGRRVAAAELHAIALDNLLSGQVLEQSPEGWVWMVTLLPCAFVGGFAASRRPVWSGLVTFIALGTVGLASLGLFLQNIWLNVAGAWLGCGLTYLIGVIGRARRQERETTRTISTIEALAQVSEIIAAQTQSGQLLDRVLLWAMNVMQATGASALLLDETGQTLHFAAATGPKAVEIMPYTLQLGEGIAGWVAQHGEPVIVNDTRRDERFKRDIDQDIQFTTKSILCVPLRVRDKMLGVIEVINRLDGSPFTEDDVELLSAVANQAAVVLENSRLYEMLNERIVQSESELAVTNQRLESERNLLQTVLQSMTDGVVVTDSAGLIQLTNPAATALLPELDRRARGKPLIEVLPEFAANLDGQGKMEADTDGHPAPTVPLRSGTLQLQRGDPDAPRLIEAHMAPLQGADGTSAGLIAVFADVTEQHDIEQAKSDFVSFVAHEMRSPLTTISGFSSMLQRSEITPGSSVAADTRARFLGIIHDESERLTRLINNLLDVARIEAGRAIELHREAFDFREVATEAAESQRAYSSRHQIECVIPDNLPLVWADRDKVTQILINLLNNALKYSPGGTVTISARAQGEYLEVSVRDEGPGIAPEHRHRLFERFGRTPARSSGPGERAKPTGTGLGLFLTKHLVETHGGRIWVESEPGHGAVFTFTLPLAREAASVDLN